MIVATGICGEYTLDVDKMLRQIAAAAAEVLTKTARHACVVDLHPDDSDQISLHTFGRDSAGKIQPLTAVIGIPVIIDRSAGRKRGVALIRQCELPHPTPQDCPYHARTARRLTSRDVFTPVRIGYTDPAQALPCKNCKHHPNYHTASGCLSKVVRDTPRGISYERCGCPEWVEA